MVRLLISLLIIALPANALATVSCCADIKPAAKIEKPCHEMPDTKKDSGDTCQGCAFCTLGSFFLPDFDQNSIGILATEKPESIQFLISTFLHLPFKPPKSV